MPRRTLYVRDEDQAIWQKAEALADQDSVSALVTEALRRFILAKEQETGMSPFERIELSVAAVNSDDAIIGDRQVAFTGRELVNEWPWQVYETAKHQLLFYTIDSDYGFYEVYKNVAAAAEARNPRDEDAPMYPSELLAAVAESLGQEWVEELDV